MKNDPAPSSTPEPSLLRSFLKFIGIDRSPDTSEELEHEFQELIDDGEEQGLISPREGKMIHSILEFRDTVAREIMTPQLEMIAVPAKTPYRELIGIIIKNGFSRIPVFDEQPDQIIGILYAKDLLRYVEAREQPCAKELCKPAYFAQEDQKIIDLLKDFQTKKIHLAIITDTFGSVRGIATLEDVLEEIVGEITDETDQPEPTFKVINPLTIVADAKSNLENIEDYFGAELPKGAFESVGGLIIHELGHLPGANSSIRINGLEFTVLSATRRRIVEVKISRTKDS